jgi:imidazole glycerol-phosphate synthase subunit HisH
MQTVALIDYGSGNLASAEKALLAAAHQANRRREVRITADPDFIARAHRIVLPGQGAFAQCMAGLKRAGVIEAMTENVRVNGAPFLGICVGMQLLMGAGFEDGETSGLDWIAGDCSALETQAHLPHMGWNEVTPAAPHPVLAPRAEAHHFYFAHSFVCAPLAASHTLAHCKHGAPFAAVIGRGNILGVQFHPEKSQNAGLALLGRFLDWKP